ncbi:MAG: hypothetical protein K2O74_08415 [Eubacteriales bacterium]|nr:hypothetical protein [Eubacteriales bacterium]
MGSVETTLAEHSEQLAAHGEQLAELRDRQLRMEMNLEHTVIPRLDILREGQQLLQDTLARKDSVEDIRDALTEWETANNVSFSEVWNRVAKLDSVYTRWKTCDKIERNKERRGTKNGGILSSA